MGEDTSEFDLGESDCSKLARDHYDYVWRYVRYLGCDEFEVDDLVQDTFLEVWRRPFRYQGARAARAYLRKVARGRFGRRIRNTTRQPLLVNLDEADAAWCDAFPDEDDSDHVLALRACFRRLPERTQRILRARYENGMRREEIAQLIGMTAEGIKTLMRRAREALRACIQKKLQP